MKIKLALFLSLALFFALAGNAYAGFGISPPSVINKNLVPGSFFEQDIYLVQSQPDQDLNVSAKIDAGEINNWIKIENGNTFQIPKGTQQFPMKVSVSVPPDAVLKNYTGKITISTQPAGEQKSGVSVNLGAQIKIDLDVTSIKVSDFSIQNFQIPDASKGKPIKFIIKVKNDGNIENGPDKVALTFFDQYHSTKLGEQEKSVSDKVKSFQTKDISVDFDNKLNEGSYWADVKIYSGGQEVVNSKIVFNVLPGSGAGRALSKMFTMPDFSKISPWIYVAILGVIIVVVLLVAVIVLVLKLKKRAPSQKEDTPETKKNKIKIHTNDKQ